MTVHEAPVGATVEWYTPPELFERLGLRFDLDPASPASGPVPWVPASKFFTPLDDGAAQPWEGRVWLNPPYGPDAARFVDRMIAHGNGMLLLASRTETRSYQRALGAATVTCLLAERLHFVREDGFKWRSSFGSTLFAFGPECAAALLASGLGRCVVAVR